MHHFIFSSKDSYISNIAGYTDVNFGLDEILEVGTNTKITKILRPTKTYTYNNVAVGALPVQNFTGIATGSFVGSSLNSYGIISGDTSLFTSSYFSGSLTASLSGYSASVPITYTSHSFSGSIADFSGSIDSINYINGLVRGSLIANCFHVYTGQLTSSNGSFTATITGNDVRNEQNIVDGYKKFLDRALIKFDLTAISSSIANGSIPNPTFTLNVKVCKEENLPLTYSIYVFPVSQSWSMGNGTYADGGSSQGVNWYYRDYDGGNIWYATSSTVADSNPDYLSISSLASASWQYGGGTWYTSSNAIQSFNYEASDIKLDVSSIVNSWLSGSIPNEGFIIMSSTEISSDVSGSNFKFFSRDTNTIYSPYLDVAWNDFTFTTGSLSTGSVITTFTSGSIVGLFLTGSISSTISGNIAGTFITSSNTSATIDVVGTSGTISGFEITGIATGSFTRISSSDAGSFVGEYISSSNNQLANLDIVITSGNLIGLEITGLATGSFATGSLSGSFITGNKVGDTIIGTAIDNIFFSGSIAGITYGNVVLSGSLVSGNAISCSITGTSISNTSFSGNITGSKFTLSGSSIIGTVSSSYVQVYVSGSLIAGNANGYFIYPNFSGSFVSGDLSGIFLTGSVLTSSYSTGSTVITTIIISSSLDPVEFNTPFAVVVRNIPSTVRSGDIIRVGIFARDQFPLKNFTKATQQTAYTIPKYLPTSSYYGIKDNETQEVVMDFDDETKLSCCYPNGNYFLLDTTGLAQERYYKILVRTEQSGSIYTFDNNNIFKITR